MSDPYLGEIRMFAGIYEPDQWKFCNGQLLDIQPNAALYALLGTRYGGDGVKTFALPDLRVRLAIGQSTSTAAPGMSAYPLASKGGSTSVTLTSAQMPSHTHAFNSTTNNATTTTPGTTNSYATAQSGYTNYIPISGAVPTTVVAMNSAAVSAAGGGQGGVTQTHSNMMPTLAINYIICINGLYPTPK